VIGRLFPMFPLTVEGLEDAVECLLKHRPDPVPDVERLLRR